MTVWLNPKIKDCCTKCKVFRLENESIYNAFEEGEILCIVQMQNETDFVRYAKDAEDVTNLECITITSNDEVCSVVPNKYDFDNLDFRQIKEVFNDKQNAKFVNRIQDIDFKEGSNLKENER